MERRKAIVTLIAPRIPSPQLQSIILAALDGNKAQHIVTIDLHGKIDFADSMIVASGTSQRHVASLADHVVERLKEAGFEHVPVEGRENCDWVLVDAGDVVVHIFKPESRAYYNLEKMWSAPMHALELAH